MVTAIVARAGPSLIRAERRLWSDADQCGEPEWRTHGRRPGHRSPRQWTCLPICQLSRVKGDDPRCQDMNPTLQTEALPGGTIRCIYPAGSKRSPTRYAVRQYSHVTSPCAWELFSASFGWDGRPTDRHSSVVGEKASHPEDYARSSVAQ